MSVATGVSASQCSVLRVVLYRLDVRKLSIEEDVDAEEDEPEEDLEKLMKLFPEHLLRTE